MTITAEESEAYKFAIAAEGAGLTLRSEPTISLAILSNALRCHVAAEMHLEFEREHEEYQATSVNAEEILPWCCTDCGQRSNWTKEHKYLAADWEQAAHEALMKGKSDERNQD